MSRQEETPVAAVETAVSASLVSPEPRPVEEEPAFVETGAVPPAEETPDAETELPEDVSVEEEEEEETSPVAEPSEEQPEEEASPEAEGRVEETAAPTANEASLLWRKRKRLEGRMRNLIRRRNKTSETTCIFALWAASGVFYSSSSPVPMHRISVIDHSSRQLTTSVRIYRKTVKYNKY